MRSLWECSKQTNWYIKYLGYLCLLMLGGLGFGLDEALAQERYTVSGYVKEAKSKESLPSINIYLPELNKGASTNNYGFYSLSLEAGVYPIQISAVGYQVLLDTLEVQADMVYNAVLIPEIYELTQIEVAGKVERETQTAQMSKVTLEAKTVTDLPSILGEKDVIKVLQLLPGVQSGSEGFGGVYVRGGGPDQNLFVLDDAVVYNASHLFGAFSIFNGDAIKSIEFFKGGFPARYGGRLSSVLDIKLKEGHANEFHGKVGVGLLSSQLVLEGPIKKEKVSFLVSARRTYFDLLIRGIQALAGNQTSFGYTLQDYNVKLNYDINNKHKVYVSGYHGSDVFSTRINTTDTGENVRDKFSVRWGNITGSVRWNYNFSPIAFSNLTTTASNYRFRISNEVDVINSTDDLEYRYFSDVTNYGMKYDIDIFPSLNHSIKTGLLLTYHRFSPNSTRLTIGSEKSESSILFEAVEQALYVEDEFRYGPFLGNIGVRVSGFTYKKKWYVRPEPRLSLGYMAGWSTTFKASYALTNQYIHLLSNSSASLPTDLWVPSTDQIGPQSAQQVALGAVKELGKNYTISVEGYYKWSKDIIDYLDGARFISFGGNGTRPFEWQSQVTTGKGRGYGVEVLVKKNVGKLNGWIGYTYSRVWNTFARINGGRPFSPIYDRRHDVSIVVIYAPAKGTTLSSTWIYGTGNTYTVPVYSTTLPVPPTLIDEGRPIEDRRTVASSRNNARGEAYHRLDLNAQFHKQVGKRKQNKRTWQVGVYNLYSRANPFAYTTDFTSNNQSQITRLALFPIIPYVTFRYEF